MANKCSHKNTTEHKDDNGHTVSYVADYWDSMPANTPDVYSFPSGSVFPTEVDDYLFDVISSAKNGIREYNWSPNSE